MNIHTRLIVIAAFTTFVAAPRAMFDLNHQRFYGGMGSSYAPGTVMTPLATGMRDFTDPALSVGGGVTIGLTEHWFLRPEARALVVFGNGASSTIAVVTVGFGYRL